MKKVLLAEDHSIVAKAIEIIFETEFQEYKLEIVRNTTSLIAAIKEERYSLVVINVQLEDGNIQQVITQLRACHADLPILIFSGHPERFFALELYKQGVKGYLWKNSDDKELIKALRTTLEGDIYISESYKQYLLSDHRNAC